MIIDQHGVSPCSNDRNPRCQLVTMIANQPVSLRIH